MTATDQGWRPVDWPTAFEWWDCTVGSFKCICGGTVPMLMDEEETCETCGRTYRLLARVEVNESKHDAAPR